MDLKIAKGWAEALKSSLVVSFEGSGFVPRSFIVGSIRREKQKEISDIDILAVIPDRYLKKLDSLEVKLRGYEIVQSIGGRRRISIKVRRKNVTLKVDVFIALHSEEPYALMHHTGSARYNTRIREHAKNKGWKLNQYGLYYRSNGKKVRGSGAVTSEQDLAKFLGVSYRHPKVRG